MAKGPERATFRLDVGEDAEPTPGRPSIDPARPPLPEPPTSPRPTADALGLLPEAPGRYQPPTDGPDLIGVGGIGRVLLVHDRALGREVALKELLARHGHDGRSAPSSLGVADDVTTGRSRPSGALLARFLREAQITARLEHPAIVPVYEVGHRADGTPYYTMRRIRGRTLADALAETTTLEGRLALLRHVVDVCYAVAYAHSRGVVHRDLKPENVMVGEFGETVVLDWGLAVQKGEQDVRRGHFVREIERLEAASLRHTLAGTVMGTPAYMSPEQAHGHVELLDERADIWSLGAVLYEVLTGAPPFDGDSAHAVLERVRSETPLPVVARCREVPPALGAIADKALSRDRAARYASAAELAQEIEAWRSGGRVGAYRYSSWELLRRFYADNRVALTIGGLAILALLVVGMLTHVQIREERDRAVSAEREARMLAEQTRLQFAESLARDAEVALRAGDRQSAELLAAGALGIREDPSSRGIVMGAGSAPRPEVTAILPDSTGCVSLVWSADGDHVACGGSRGVRLWSVAAPGPPVVVEADGRRVRGVGFAPDGARMYTGDSAGQVYAWEVASRRAAWTTQLDGLVVASLAVSPDGAQVALGGKPARPGLPYVVVLDREGTPVAGWTGPSHAYSEALAWSADGATLWSAGWSIEGRDAAGLVVGRVGDEGSAALAVAVSPTNRIAASWQSQALELSGADDRPPQRLALPDVFTRSLAFRPDGELLASGSSDGTVRLWDTTTGDERARLVGYPGRAPVLAFSPGGNRLAAGADEAPVRIWDLAPLDAAPGVTLPPTASWLAPSGGYVAWVEAGAVVFADPSTGVETARSTPLPLASPFATWAVGGDRVWLQLDGDEAALVDARTGAVLPVPLPGPARVVAVALGADGGFATLQLDGRVAAYDAAGVRRWHRPLPQPTTGEPGTPTSLTFSPDAALVSVVCPPSRIVRLSADTGAPIEPLPLAGLRSTFVAFSQDGRRFAASADDDTVRVLSVEDASEIARLHGHTGSAWGATFTEDGGGLLTVGGDESARLWRLSDNREVARLGRPGAFVWQGAFPPGGELAYTAGNDATLRRWDLGSLARPGAALLREAERLYGLELRGSAVVPAAELRR